jgi:hypothetical protein
MLKIASTIPRRAPARRSAANDDPYSTSRSSPRWYQTEVRDLVDVRVRAGDER